jgi:hypothetical protein
LAERCRKRVTGSSAKLGAGAVKAPRVRADDRMAITFFIVFSIFETASTAAREKRETTVYIPIKIKYFK